MNKKTIITILLALVTMTGQAKKTIVWENPSVAYSAIPYFQIHDHGDRSSDHFSN